MWHAMILLVVAVATFLVLGILLNVVFKYIMPSTDAPRIPDPPDRRRNGNSPPSAEH